MHHHTARHSQPHLLLPISLALAVSFVVLFPVPAVASADTYSWGVGGDAAFSFDSVDAPFSIAADGSLNFQYTGISEGQSSFYADSAGFDVPLYGQLGVKKTFDTLTYMRSNDTRGVDIGFFYKTSVNGNWLPIDGTAFEAYAGGERLWYRMRVTVDTAQPMSSPLTITVITVSYGDYVPLPKTKGDGKTKKSQHKPAKLGPGVYHYPQSPSGTNTGPGTGAGSQSGSGAVGDSHAGSAESSAVGQATPATSSPPASAPGGDVPAGITSGAANGTMVQGYQLMPGDYAVAGAASSGGAPASGFSVPSTGGASVNWGLILGAALVVTLLAAPGPIVSRRLRRTATFDHVRARRLPPYRPLG